MPAQKIGSILASGELGRLAGKAHRLMKLQQLFFESAPPLLAPGCRVAYCRAGVLFLSADNAATAAKLRQLAPRILANIRKREPEITGIRIDVQVGGGAGTGQRRTQKSALPPEIVEKFRTLSDRLPESSLRTALASMVRHHAQESGGAQTTSTRRSRR